MKLKITALTFSMLLASPMLWAGEHDSERINTEHRASNPRARMRLEELKELHKQAEDFNAHNEKLKAHHAPYSDASGWVDTSATSSVFQEKSTIKKLTDFFSDTFNYWTGRGDKVAVKNALSRHSASGTSSARVFSVAETNAFKALKPEKQEDVLNDWLKDEVSKRKANEAKNEADYLRYKNDDKALEAKTVKDKATFTKQSTDAVDSVRTVIRQFKSDFPDAQTTEISTLMNTLAVKGKQEEIATDTELQATLKSAIDKMTDLLESQKAKLVAEKSSLRAYNIPDLTEKIDKLDESMHALKKAQDTVTTNSKAIEAQAAKIETLKKNLENDFTVGKFNTRHVFNLRIIQFRNEIEAMLGKDLTLKYNPKTESFVLAEKTEGSGAKSEAAPAEPAPGTTVSPTDGTPAGDGATPTPVTPVTRAEATTDIAALERTTDTSGVAETASEQADEELIRRGVADDAASAVEAAAPFAKSVMTDEEAFEAKLQEMEDDEAKKLQPQAEFLAQQRRNLEKLERKEAAIITTDATATETTIKTSTLTKPEQVEAKALVQDEATLARESIVQAEKARKEQEEKEASAKRKEAEAKRIAEKDAKDTALKTKLDRFSNLGLDAQVELMQEALSGYDQLSEALKTQIKAIVDSLVDPLEARINTELTGASKKKYDQLTISL